MTLEQLEGTLPNGLHDARICSFTRDLDAETLSLTIDVLVGLPDDPPERQDDYREAVITFSGIKLLVAECPDASSAFVTSGRVTFSISRSKPGTFSPHIEGRLPDGLNHYSLYVLDWESSIHLAAADLTFEWL